MVSEETLRRWMAIEMKQVHERLARTRRPLTELQAMEEPGVPTRGGGSHAFRLEELERWHDALRPHERHRLRLPVFLYRDHQSRDSAFLDDERAVQALQRMGLVDADRSLRDGKLWMGTPLAVKLVEALPTTVQLVMR